METTKATLKIEEMIINTINNTDKKFTNIEW